MSIRLTNNGQFKVDNTREYFNSRIEAEQRLKELRVITRYKRVGRVIRGKYKLEGESGYERGKHFIGILHTNGEGLHKNNRFFMKED